MKVIIAGGRDYVPTASDTLLVGNLLVRHKATEIVSGGAKGVDEWGERLACQMGIPVTRFKPDWNLHGKAAGPKRNAEMAEYCDAVILLPGGNGTASMRREAIKRNKPIIYEARVWNPPKEAK